MKNTSMFPKEKQVWAYSWHWDGPSVNFFVAKASQVIGKMSHFAF